MVSASNSKPRIAIVGAGITGVFAAYFLARLGADALIIERDRVAAGASGHNAGGLNPLQGPGVTGPIEELALESLRLHLESWQEIERLAGTAFGGQFVPRLIVATNESQAAELARHESIYNATPGFSARWLSGPALGEVKPRLSPEAIGGLWTTGNARVDPGPYTRAVAAAAERLGAKRVRTQMQGIRTRGERVIAVTLDSGDIDCDGLVIATGPWCELPSRWLGVPIPVEPVKGELLLADPGEGVPQAEMVWDGFGVYMAPGRRVWLGGTEDRSGFDLAPTASARSLIVDAVKRVVPGLELLEIVRHTAALRPVTPDGLPIVGIPGRWENVCLAVGSGRKGMLLGAGLGLATAELLLTGHTHVPIGPCAPERPELTR